MIKQKEINFFLITNDKIAKIYLEKVFWSVFFSHFLIGVIW